jgi:hypothetical protein
MVGIKRDLFIIRLTVQDPGNQRPQGDRAIDGDAFDFNRYPNAVGCISFDCLAKLAERGGFDDLSPESTTYLKYTSLSPLLATK